MENGKSPEESTMHRGESNISPPLKQIVVSSFYIKKNTGDSNFDCKDHYTHPKRIKEIAEEEELSEESPGYNRITISSGNNHINLQGDGIGIWQAKDYPKFHDSLQHNLDIFTENEIRIMEENELKKSKFWCNELAPEDAEKEAMKIEGIKETLNDKIMFGGAIEMMLNHTRRDKLMGLMGVVEVPTKSG
jgi:hypothetical protein